ncbi:MAG: acyl carrier protein [Smithella sp.]|jgi:acyl carrier protein|nr:acyl carrier protein [Smithella sp.]MDD5503173.1 acyl carrier protein [Candidatus Thermoplasmatota archaeon]
MESYDTISRLLRKELHNMKPDLPLEYGDGAHFTDQLGLDSLDLAEFVALIEQRYRVEVDDADWKNLSSIHLTAEHVLKLLYASAS